VGVFSATAGIVTSLILEAKCGHVP